MRTKVPLWLALLLFLVLPRLAGAQRPLGPPFDVNVPTAAQVRLSSLAMNARGDFVAVWVRQAVHVGEIPMLLARRFAADGTPVTGEIAVASDPNPGPDSAKAVMNDDGSFVVVLTVFPDLLARRYGPDGSFVGESVAASPASPSGYRVAARPRGGFVLAWLSERRVFVRVFGAAGEPTGPVRQVTVEGGTPGVAVGPDGDFVVIWTAFKPDPEDPRYADPYLVAQRFDAAGARVGGRILVQPLLIGGAISFPAVAEDGEGRFLVLWQGRIGTEEGIYARRYAGDGTPLTGRLKLEGATATAPQLAMDQAGNFVVAWLQLGAGPNGQTGVFAQRFTSGGAPFRPAFRVDTSGLGEPLVASDANGNFVVAGGRGREILARLYRKQ